MLDLGCGDGVIAEDLMARGVDVIGVDSSPDFVKAAQARGVDARLMDGQTLTFDSGFDAVFSNAALHWMTDAAAVTTGVWRALRPGGRFVAEFGGHGNVAAIVTAMRAVGLRRGGDITIAAPWYFPSPEIYGALLASHGFGLPPDGPLPQPTHLPTRQARMPNAFPAPFLAPPAGSILYSVIELANVNRQRGHKVLGSWALIGERVQQNRHDPEPLEAHQLRLRE